MAMRFCPSTGKVSYITMTEAQKQIGTNRDRGFAKMPLKAYRCPKCGDWHITKQLTPHKPKKRG